MPRDSNGNYTLPAGNPVAAGTLIEAEWANSTMEDIRDALNDSLSRSGDGGMLVPLMFADGTEAAPGIAWVNEPSTGFFREGLGDMRVTILGQEQFRWLTDGTFEWVEEGNGGAGEWRRLVASNNITVDAEDNVTFSGDVDLGDSVIYRGDDLANYINQQVTNNGILGTPHRYWRVQILFEDTFTYLRELNFFSGGGALQNAKRWSPGVQNNNALSPPAISFGPNNDPAVLSGPPLATVVNGLTTQEVIFSSQGGGPQILEMDLDFGEDTPYALSSLQYVGLRPHNDPAGNPTAVKLFYSDDDVSYTEVGSFVPFFPASDTTASPHLVPLLDPADNSPDDIITDLSVRTVPTVSLDLGDLTDVDDRAPADTNVLTWDATTQLWGPAAAGGGGGSDWTYDTTEKDAGFTAVVGNFYLINADEGNFNITLPSSPRPNVGERVGFSNTTPGASTITFFGGGSQNIMGQASADLGTALSSPNVIFVWVGGAFGWAVYSGDVVIAN